MNGSSQQLPLPTRGTALRGRVLEAVVLGYSLIAGAFQSNPPSLAGEPKGLARLGIAVGTGMLALVIRSRLTRRQDRLPSALVVDLVTVYGFVVLSQVILACFRPNLVLPGWAPTQGGFVGIMLFAATRALLAAFAGADEILPASNDALKKEIANTCSRHRTRTQRPVRLRLRSV